MDIRFSPEEQRFRGECREWLHANVPSERRPIDAADAIGFDKAWQRQLFDAGWAGINWPVEYGGRGLSIVQQVIWLEEYAKAHAPWIGANFVGVNHGGPTLIMNASATQKEYHLPRILKGEAIWCQGFSEPGAGAAGSTPDCAPPSVSICQACSASGVRLVKVMRVTEAMLANASPRKPRLPTRSKSSKLAILLVAWRASASANSAPGMPPPLSVT